MCAKMAQAQRCGGKATTALGFCLIKVGLTFITRMGDQ